MSAIAFACGIVFAVRDEGVGRINVVMYAIIWEIVSVLSVYTHVAVVGVNASEHFRESCSYNS